MSLRTRVAACVAVLVVFLAAPAGAQAPAAPMPSIAPTIPGDPALKPARVRIGVDTIALLVTPKDSAEHLSSLLIRAIARVDGPNGPMLRETQRYESHEATRPGFSYDTLDVDARTLRPMRSFFSGGGITYDVRFSDLKMDGTITTPDSGKRDVHVTAQAPFFHGMMQEAFIGAFPLVDGATVAIPSINPPTPTVRPSQFEVVRRETIRTAGGPVPCFFVTTGRGNVHYWLAVDDNRLMRMHWTLPNGTSIWKIPQRDVAFRAAAGN